MLRLPRTLSAQLRDTGGRALAVADVLIGVNLLVDGRYYYGTLVGLTNSRGVARTEGARIEEQFRSDQSDFPMDYKVALENCDSEVEVLVLSQSEIDNAKAQFADATIVSHDVREIYGRAQNWRVEPATLRTVLKADAAVIPVTTELTGAQPE
jgi:hypothetical protein